MRVAIVEPVGGHGGMNYYDFGLSSALVNAGASVNLYTCDETLAPANSNFSCKFFFRKIYGNSPKLVRGIRFFIGLVFSLLHAKIFGARIVHFHFFHSGTLELVSSFISKSLGLKVIITVHDVESFSGNASNQVSRWIFSTADGLVVHNKFSQGELCRITGLPESKINVIPHGSYVDFFEGPPSKKEARSFLGVDPERKVVLFFGQIKTVKGLDVLLNAFSLALKDHPDALLIVAGKVWKDDFSIYEKIISQKEISSNLRFDIRYVPDSEVQYYYKAADMVVLPYRAIYQSGVLLMAMSLGTLVITSDIPGMTEVVTNEENGLTFRSGDAEDLYSVLSSALKNPATSQRIADEGYRLMLEKYAWNTIGETTFSMYEKILRH